MQQLTGVLLAGGAGLRLGGAVDGRIKSLVEIGGKPLVHYAIDFLKAAGADEIIVIGAHDFENLKTKTLERDNSVKVLEGDTRGSLYSLNKVWPEIKNSFLLANADHIYKKPIAGKVASQLQGITVFCDFDRPLGDDDMKVWHNDFKLDKISKKLTEWNGGYVGLTFCHKDFFPIYEASMRELMEKNGGTVVEDALRNLIGRQIINISDISGHGWLEVDFPEELERARQEIASKKDEYFL